jgi:hypothetical protein
VYVTTLVHQQRDLKHIIEAVPLDRGDMEIPVDEGEAKEGEDATE